MTEPPSCCRRELNGLSVADRSQTGCSAMYETVMLNYDRSKSSVGFQTVYVGTVGTLTSFLLFVFLVISPTTAPIFAPQPPTQEIGAD